MTPEIAKLALQFLERVQLSGQEIPAYLAVQRELQSVADPEKAAPPVTGVDNVG